MARDPIAGRALSVSLRSSASQERSGDPLREAGEPQAGSSHGSRFWAKGHRNSRNLLICLCFGAKFATCLRVVSRTITRAPSSYQCMEKAQATDSTALWGWNCRLFARSVHHGPSLWSEPYLSSLPFNGAGVRTARRRALDAKLPRPLGPACEQALRRTLREEA
jgi:hypothetical protein